MPKKEDTPPPLNVLDHIFVPNHEILDKQEAKDILKNYHAKPDQLPYILHSDPAVQQIDASPGDILRITRQSETAGTALYYRLVIEG